MNDPAYDLALYLQAQGLGSLTKLPGEWWLVPGQQTTDKHKQVSLLDTPGYPPQFSSTDVLKRPTVQVLALGDANQYQETREQIEAIYTAVEGKCDVTINGHRYLSLEPLQEPVWLGYRDGDRRPEWSLNVLMMTE